MKQIILIGIACGGLLGGRLGAQEVKEQRATERFRAMLLQRFDKDGDGRLSPTERQAIRDERKQQKEAQQRATEELTERTWNVAGLERRALIHLPPSLPPAQPPTADTTKRPVVFAFHGHGGSAPQAAARFAFHQAWPDAIVVYMEGVPTPGRLTDPQGKKRGWQSLAGDHGDRDLKFFDAVWATLKREFPVDQQRVYSTGHSNGGAFTFLLWGARADTFAAVAPSAAAWRNIRTLTPKPAMHLAGKNDSLVKFSWQADAMRVQRNINGCRPDGAPWQEIEGCTVYQSDLDAPCVTYLHEQGHRYPDRATELIVRFFQEHETAK
jgi:polyhydroxybutyrate depolymerase